MEITDIPKGDFDKDFTKSSKFIREVLTCARREDFFNFGFVFGKKALERLGFILNKNIDYNYLASQLDKEKRELLLFILWELSIIAFYVGEKELGLSISDQLCISPFEVGSRDRVHKNIIYYVNKIKSENRFKIDIEAPLIEDDPGQTYNLLNPSLLLTDDGYIINCRAVNYIQINGYDYIPKHKDNIFRTRNYLLKTDKDWNILAKTEIIDKSNLIKIKRSGQSFNFKT